jgi:MFS transporter, DHA2 family, multidrug resistance protein
MDKVVHRDALLLAYSDGFLLAGLAMLLCVLAGFLLRRA